MGKPVAIQRPATRFKQYAACMASKSWCVDVSGLRPVALHAESNRTASPEFLAYEYFTWERSQGWPLQKEDIRSVLEQIIQELPRVFGSSFRPTDEKFFETRGVLVANTYRPYKPDLITSESGERLLNELAERLFPDANERKYVLQYLAHMVFRPTERPQFGLLITGAGGTGKSLLVQLVERALGGHHWWRENDYDAAFKTFSEVLPNHLAVTFDDAPSKSATYELLKHAITSSHQEVEIKGGQRRVLREVYARIIILSNERRPFDLTEDRRFYVPSYCVHRIGKDESGSFFRGFVAWLNGPQSGAVIYNWLRQIDLSGFDPASPVITDAHRGMGSVSGSDLSDLISDYVQDQRLVHFDEIAFHVTRLGRATPNRPEVEVALKKVGYTSRRRTHPSGAGQLEIWVPASRRRQRSLNEEELTRMKAAGVLT